MTTVAPAMGDIAFNNSAQDENQCLVCYSELTICGKVACGHDNICGVCHLRLRHLHDDTKCPICKASNEHVIVDYSNNGKGFDDYPQWGNEIGAGYVYRESVGMFFETSYYEKEIVPLFGYSCDQCDFDCTDSTGSKHSPLRQLQDHLRTKHRKAICNLCVDHKRDFVSRLQRMTPKQLQTHFHTGDGPKSGFSGHPVCEFCKPTRFYDLACLHQHLHKEHYECHVCKKQGLDNQFFKDYSSLQKHFDNQHFLCHDPQCLSARFVVFANELDLRAHEMSVHGGGASASGSTKINLEFRTRRQGYDGSGLADNMQATPNESDFNFSVDGQAFVPAALPTTGDRIAQIANSSTASNGQDSVLHPFHQQRTEEFRQHAAEIRSLQSVDTEQTSFPSLQAANNAANSAPLIGWASGATMTRLNAPRKQAGKVTEQEFPSLQSDSKSNESIARNAKKQAIKGNIGATRRQFAAMTTTASQPSWNSGPNAQRKQLSTNSNAFPVSSPPTSNTLSNDNFPSLGGVTPRLSQNATPSYPPPPTRSSVPVARRPAPPSIENSVAFPSLGAPSGAHQQRNTTRNKLLGNTVPKGHSDAALSNVLQVDMSSQSAITTVDEMKASLGPKKYKELKRLTRDFAQSTLSPEGYVDQSAALFDRGYADQDFWTFLPSLLASCPNDDGAENALKYMTSLRRQQYRDSTPNTTFHSQMKSPRPAAQWGSTNGNHNRVAASSLAAMSRAPLPKTQTITQAMARPIVVPSKKKGAWGGSQGNTVRAKPTPGSVMAAAKEQGPQGGSATKFMAKNQPNKNGAWEQPKSKNKKKKKEKDDLRALAFGTKR